MPHKSAHETSLGLFLILASRLLRYTRPLSSIYLAFTINFNIIQYTYCLLHRRWRRGGVTTTFRPGVAVGGVADRRAACSGFIGMGGVAAARESAALLSGLLSAVPGGFAQQAPEHERDDAAVPVVGRLGIAVEADREGQVPLRPVG